MVIYRDTVDHDAMKECLVREVESLLKMSSISHVTSIYFGGGIEGGYTNIYNSCDQNLCTGTPSLAEPATVEAVINAVCTHSRLDSDAEINLEANPTSAEMKKLR